jgi:hypothetical protein
LIEHRLMLLRHLRLLGLLIRLYRGFQRWEEMTLEHIDPRLLELVSSLARLAPPAVVGCRELASIPKSNC